MVAFMSPVAVTLRMSRPAVAVPVRFPVIAGVVPIGYWWP